MPHSGTLRTDERPERQEVDHMDFVELLRALLVEENGKTPEEAAALVNKHVEIVAQGIMHGLSFTNLRVTAAAIGIAELDGRVISEPRRR